MRIRVDNGKVVCNNVVWRREGVFYLVLADFRAKRPVLWAYGNADWYGNSAMVCVGPDEHTLHLDESSTTESCMLWFGGMRIIELGISRYTLSGVLAPYWYDPWLKDDWQTGWVMSW